MLCEVYDGQFHDLIVRSDSGKALTQIQNAKDFFWETMENFDKDTLISTILPYSKIDASDLDITRQTQFRHNVVTKLNTVTLECKHVLNLQKDNFICTMFIKSNTKGNYSMEDFVTNYCKRIWNSYLGYKTANKLTGIPIENKLSHEELRDLIKGTKLHRRISSQTITEISSINSESDKSNDPDSFQMKEYQNFLTTMRTVKWK